MDTRVDVSARRARLCLWCAAQLDSRVADGGLLRCQACGAAATEPWPSEEELERAYAEWYRPDSGRFSGVGEWLLAHSRGRLARRLDLIAPLGPVLDVGAGDGTLIRGLRARGRQAEGLERTASVPWVREAEVTEIEGSWAAIVFWHSLEHLRAPGRALDHAAGLLAPGGVLAIAVPNIESLQARVFGARWFGLDLPRHLVHLPEQALVARLGQLGLRVERVSHWRGGQIVFGWLHGLVGALPGRPDLYDAIRRAPARRAPMRSAERRYTLLAGVLLLPVALAASAVEVVVGRSGTVYVEARRV
jgi:SAM-dependent methyltransferase